jgi:predicted Holliday junction resolvase-like endonuclease
MQGIEALQKKLDQASEKLDEKEESIRENARTAGRDEANRVVTKIDKIFKPRRINPDDSKVIFHPVDFIIFNGMKAGTMKNLILMDKPQKTLNEKRLQRSIIRAVEKEKYEWVTLRIEDNGNISEE